MGPSFLSARKRRARGGGERIESATEGVSVSPIDGGGFASTASPFSLLLDRGGLGLLRDASVTANNKKKKKRRGEKTSRNTLRAVAATMASVGERASRILVRCAHCERALGTESGDTRGPGRTPEPPRRPMGQISPLNAQIKNEAGQISPA